MWPLGNGHHHTAIKRYRGLRVLKQFKLNLRFQRNPVSYMKAVPKTLSRDPRQFVGEDFTVSSWEAIEPFYQQLLEREVNSAEEMRAWYRDRSELESVLSEDLAWRYINMTRDTGDEESKERYQYFISEISPKVAPYSDKLNNKALGFPYWSELDLPGYANLHRSLKKDVRIYREENIPLYTEMQTRSKEYSAISGAMTVEINDQEYTLQQAAVMLQLPERDTREKVYRKISQRRLQDRDRLDALFNDLIKLRHQIATNADFQNYRDYMFTAMGRFDYKPQDCFDFHESVAKEIVPMVREMSIERRELMKLPALRPWDKAVDPLGRAPLRPFEGGQDLLEKTITCFSKLDPFLGDCLRTMQEMGHLDLESRKGKAPGGYNYPLAETGVPFIFMNATSTLRDLVTILHEGGHAVHSFVTRDLELSDFKSTPSEVAELASMSMELISMDHWDIYFDHEDDLKRAKQEHLQQVIETLPWVATIDKFQHWIYENFQQDGEQRKRKWNEIFDLFTDEITEWEGLEEAKDYLWQKQLHLFEVPFYYIEYGMAQLGAVAIWKNYKDHPKQGLTAYLDALRLGYTKTIPEIYQAANIKFDFSRSYIKELMTFVKQEMSEI